MLTCETCGCLVDPEMTEIHQNWHEDLVKKSDLNKGCVANPRRTKLDEIIAQDC
jgi:hypothetical protein